MSGRDELPAGYSVEYGSHRTWRALHHSKVISAWSEKASARAACFTHAGLPLPEAASCPEEQDAAPVETCPECGRQKARSAHDAAAGMCPKWWAIADKDADADCARHTTPPPSTGEAKTVEPVAWRDMASAPRNATEIILRIPCKGWPDHYRQIGHWAEDMSGEEQPPFRGWFRKTGFGCAELEEPTGWMLLDEDHEALRAENAILIEGIARAGIAHDEERSRAETAEALLADAERRIVAARGSTPNVAQLEAAFHAGRNSMSGTDRHYAGRAWEAYKRRLPAALRAADTSWSSASDEGATGA